MTVRYEAELHDRRNRSQDATARFGVLLSEAIAANLESPIRPVFHDDYGTERPLSLLEAPPLDPGPSKPQTLTQIANKLNDLRHAEFRDELFQRSRRRPQVGKFLVTDLTDDVCHYPFGDGPFFFCGASVQFKSYCECHARECFR